MTKNDYTFDDFLIGLSFVSVILAFVGATGNDIYLASTQWMVIAAVLAIWGIYYRIRGNK